MVQERRPRRLDQRWRGVHRGHHDHWPAGGDRRAWPGPLLAGRPDPGQLQGAGPGRPRGHRRSGTEGRSAARTPEGCRPAGARPGPGIHDPRADQGRQPRPERQRLHLGGRRVADQPARRRADGHRASRVGQLLRLPGQRQAGRQGHRRRRSRLAELQARVDRANKLAAQLKTWRKPTSARSTPASSASACTVASWSWKASSTPPPRPTWTPSAPN
jgi:hypothetical protein